MPIFILRLHHDKKRWRPQGRHLFYVKLFYKVVSSKTDLDVLLNVLLALRERNLFAGFFLALTLGVGKGDELVAVILFG